MDLSSGKTGLGDPTGCESAENCGKHNMKNVLRSPPHRGRGLDEGGTRTRPTRPGIIDRPAVPTETRTKNIATVMLLSSSSDQISVISLVSSVSVELQSLDLSFSPLAASKSRTHVRTQNRFP